MDPRINLITLRGALDLASERSLRADLSAAAGDLSRALVLDLRGVTLIDSMGLAVLVHADQQFRRQGRSMACVVRDDGPLQRLLEATGMRDALLQFRSLESAASHVLRDRSRAGALEP
jgi:anti-anti-sigma factor